MNHIAVKNNERLSLTSIPRSDYERFLEHNTALLDDSANHCVTYFGVPEDGKIKLICGIANDNEHNIYLSCAEINRTEILPSFSKHHLAFQVFERELHENFGINFSDHPWLKPVRFAFDRADKDSCIEYYPFYQSDSVELHEVGVGPIHAGIIEPGHFRFICNGEQILHLEIQLGFQHRGIERLFLEKKTILQRTTLAESIAGDTVAGHTTAFVNLWEALCGFQADDELRFTRTLALELERIAVHTGDLSAICTDIGYQLGNAVFGRLRTPIINFFQQWCGNRLAKGLIRAGNNHFPFDKELGIALKNMLDQYKPDFNEICQKTFRQPSVLSRLEKTGVVSWEQAGSIGAVGMAARASGSERDIRKTHPHDKYINLGHQPVIKHHGDVYSRVQVRKAEIIQSIGYIRDLLMHLPAESREKKELGSPAANSIVISLTEGWRGEICHCAITDQQGALRHYKIKDPSIHNWVALALAVRNNEISDFPVCNKSFNLSYSGHDL